MTANDLPKNKEYECNHFRTVHHSLFLLSFSTEVKADSVDYTPAPDTPWWAVVTNVHRIEVD